VLSAAQLTAATGLLVLVTPAAGLQPIQLTPAVLAAISILGALGTGTAYVLNYRLITDEGPTATSTVTYLMPVVAVALGIVFLGEPAAAHLLIGPALSWSASLSCRVARQHRRRRRRPRPESASRERAAWDGLRAVLVVGALFSHRAQGGGIWPDGAGMPDPAASATNQGGS
jgi:EamA-like transporter family